MENKKILMVLTPFIAILLIGVVFFPDLVNSIWTTVTGQEVSCDDAPNNPNCYCTEGFNKIELLGFYKYYCESENLMFDPQSPTFESDALAFAKAYLYEHYPECDSIECPEPATLLSNADLVYTPEHRAVYFECRNPIGKDYWETQFSLETGNMERVFCNNVEEMPEPSDNPSTLIAESEWNNIEKAFFKAKYRFSVDCTDESGIATTTVNVPEGFIAEEWDLIEGGYSTQLTNGRYKAYSTQYDNQYCSILESDSSSAKIECNANCPTQGFSGYSFNTFAYYSLNYMNSNYCKLSDLNPLEQGKYYSIGYSTCCADKKKYECNSNLEWQVVPNVSCSATTYYC